MAAHRRRLTPAAAVRVGLILCANAAAIWFLWTETRGNAEAAGAAPAATNASVADERRFPADRPADPVAQAWLDRLGARIRPLVRDAERRAIELAPGRAQASDIHVAVHLRDANSGAEYGLDAARAMRPASNMKIVTTVAALTLLGTGWEFTTAIEASGPLVEGRLEGDLVLRAAGDPLFDPEAEGSVARLLAPAIDELERRGLTRVRGDLVLDEAGFDLPAWPDGWPGKEQRAEEYCALSGGFSANRGCLTIRVAPTSPGALARVDVAPAGFSLERRISATTSSGGPSTLGFDARPSGLIVRGTIPRGSAAFVDSCPVPDPVVLFGEVLRHELAARGIAIEGTLRRERGVPAGERLAEIRTPLSSYLAPINQESNNAVADQVFLGLAHAHLGSGARAGAQRATLDALERLGVSDADFRQVDGSGLSRLNRVSARQLSALLQAVLASDRATANLYRDSLAIAGVSGTLDKRMRHSPARGRVRGKTGFIAGTSSLSGVATAPDEREIVFSILVNYPDVDGLNSQVWKPMEDAICDVLVEAAP